MGVNIPTIRDVSVAGKRVLVRVDFNVPLDSTGQILDSTRIEAALPTLRYLLKEGAIPVVMSHLGRPKGQVISSLSLKPVAEELKKRLDADILLAPAVVGKEVKEILSNCSSGQLVLLENMRFEPEEEQPSASHELAHSLAELGDLYVNDAFGTAHRKHSSTYILPQLFSDRSVLGLLMAREVKALQELVHPSKAPFLALIGGCKISTKMHLVEALAERCRAICIGGAMAFTFLKAQGIDVGDSLVEEDQLLVAQSIVKQCKKTGCALHLPLDFIAVKKIQEDAPSRIIDFGSSFLSGEKGVDIGPKTIQEWKTLISKAKMILWNGPLGMFETVPFDRGTNQIAQAIAGSGAESYVGGGESLAALTRLKLKEKVSHFSTGGAAMLQFIEKGTLPGIEAIFVPAT